MIFLVHVQAGKAALELALELGIFQSSFNLLISTSKRKLYKLSRRTRQVTDVIYLLTISIYCGTHIIHYCFKVICTCDCKAVWKMQLHWEREKARHCCPMKIQYIKLRAAFSYFPIHGQTVQRLRVMMHHGSKYSNCRKCLNRSLEDQL